jgi:Uma2 family endonuclease
MEFWDLLPKQGSWTEDEYLELTQSMNCFVEFTDGSMEVLKPPTEIHQRILLFLLDEMRAFAEPTKRGETLPCVFRVRIRSGKFREPDLVFMLSENSHRRHNEYWDGADLVMEVVGPEPKSRQRDHETKRVDYAEGGISEYWIVDPQEEKITVLKLAGDSYLLHGEFRPGQTAASALLQGFEVGVSAVFAAGRES